MEHLPQAPRAASPLIGTAGWTIPAVVGAEFPDGGSHLERYARRFGAVEINSSFHRPHRLSTYQRWAASVPPGFRFSVKLPKSISHAGRLAVDELLDAFVAEVAGLGAKLEVVLVQLPPKFAFDPDIAWTFFSALQNRIEAAVACEPRHAGWFTPEADALLAGARVARVAANPVLAAGGEQPGGWPGLRYHRLHGAPRVYYSSYADAELRNLADSFEAGSQPCWCIFDNTASGAATGDALRLQALLA